MENNKIRYTCSRCGETLTTENSRETNEKWAKNGISHYCISCEQDYFSRLATTVGRHLALFYSCITFNVPFNVLALEKTGDKFKNSNEGWVFYIDRLAELGLDRRGDKILTFFDGETNLLRIFGREFTEKDFAKAIMVQREILDKQSGTPEQRERWGVDDKWTTQTYNELDRLFEVRASSYKGQQLTPQMEATLIKVAKWDYIVDDYVKKNNTKAAKNMQDMIEQVLSSEQMRRKDEKPIEQFRIDALIDAMEKNGLMENGVFVNYDKVREALRDNHIETHKYNYPLDAADQMLFDIENNFRRNADMQLVSELPADMQVVDYYNEFDDEASEEYKKKRDYANLLPIQFNKVDKKNEDTKQGKKGTRKEEKAKDKSSTIKSASHNKGKKNEEAGE